MKSLCGFDGKCPDVVPVVGEYNPGILHREGRNKPLGANRRPVRALTCALGMPRRTAFISATISPIRPAAGTVPAATTVPPTAPKAPIASYPPCRNIIFGRPPAGRTPATSASNCTPGNERGRRRVYSPFSADIRIRASSTACDLRRRPGRDRLGTIRRRAVSPFWRCVAR